MTLYELERISILLGVVASPATRTRESMQEICSLADSARPEELAFATHKFLFSLLQIERAETERQLAAAKGGSGAIH